MALIGRKVNIFASNSCFNLNWISVTKSRDSFNLFSFFSKSPLQKCRLQQDLNSDLRSRRRARWLLDHHHGPIYLYFDGIIDFYHIVTVHFSFDILIIKQSFTRFSICNNSRGPKRGAHDDAGRRRRQRRNFYHSAKYFIFISEHSRSAKWHGLLSSEPLYYDVSHWGSDHLPRGSASV